MNAISSTRIFSYGMQKNNEIKYKYNLEVIFF